MGVLVLFAASLEKEHCVCLGFRNNQEDSELPLLKRSFNDIFELSKTRDLFLILPQATCGLYRVELPWLSEKKARMTLPYALEEQLAQSLSSLHFSYSKQYYSKHHYLVLSYDADALKQLLDNLKKVHLEPSVCTSDWFALEAQSIALTPQNLMINTPEFQGTLPYHMVEFLPELTYTTVYRFLDSPPVATPFSANKIIEYDYHRWVGNKIIAAGGINLLQGDFALKQKHPWQGNLYSVIAGLAVLWLISIVSVDLWQLHRYRQENKALSARIEGIYRKIFPQATQVINPRFRIARALKDQESGKKTTLWALLAASLQAIDTQAITINTLRYQNDTLRLSLSAPSFEQLEQLQDTLQMKAIKVRQSNASSLENSVTANLELRL